MTIRTCLLAMLAALPLFGACSSGAAHGESGTGSGESGTGSGESGTGSGAFYTKRCIRTSCDSCRDLVASNCSQCTSLCSRPGAYSGCYSDCSDLCGRECGACSGPSSCQEWEVELPLLAEDQRLFDSCLEKEETCAPDDYDRSYCHHVARYMGPEMIAEFDCLNERGCDAADECSAASTSGGTLGTSFCKRSTGCGRTCDEGEEGLLNAIGDTLRPELKRSLQQCIAEPSCGDFKACARAHADLWRLTGATKADPGSPSECSQAWMSECGTCICGFSCIRGCSGCTARCVMPCDTDADCAGTSTGTTPTPVCSKILDYPGFCTIDRY